jgi:hypothetical protein
MKKMLLKIKLVISIARKKYIVLTSVRRMGGKTERTLLRNIRREGIIGEKRTVVISMLTDWSTGETKTPFDHEREEFESMARRKPNSTLSWEKIHGIQKKYWDERNIYS